MFNPKTIALIGASGKEGAVGRTILEMEENGKNSMIGVTPSRTRPKTAIFSPVSSYGLMIV
jgi:acyl-CoA synthetase (NDP forming)